MAEGDIGAVIDTLATAGEVVVNVSGDVYAVVSGGSLKTFTVSSAGAISDTVLYTETFAATSTYPNILKIADGIFLISYRNAAYNVQLMTYPISDAGVIGALINSYQLDTSNANFSSLVHISGTVYGIVYGGYGTGISRLRTINIADNGTIGAVIATLTFDTANFSWNKIVHVSGTVYAISYSVPNTTGKVMTVSISTDGATLSTIDNLTFTVDSSRSPIILHCTGNIYVVTCGGPLKTFTVETNGQVGASVIDTYAPVGSYNVLASIIHVSGDVYCFSYGGPSTALIAETVSIDSAGQISDTNIDSLGIVNPGDYPSLLHVSGNIYVVAYGSAIKTFDVETIIAPIFPVDAITRVTGITHRYDRAKQIYSMELTLGNVTSDFGLPEWSSRPQSAAVEQEEKIDKAPETSTSYGPRVEELVHGPLPRELDTIKPSARKDEIVEYGPFLRELRPAKPSTWSKITPWKEEEGETMLSSAIARTKAQWKKRWMTW